MEEIPIPERSFRPAHYVQIVTILLHNALIALSYKHFDENGEPRIELNVGTRENQLTISVIDNGVGLPAGVPPRALLDKFTSHWPRPNRKMGNELYKCKELVEKNHGTIELIADGGSEAMAEPCRTRVEVSIFLPPV